MAIRPIFDTNTIIKYREQVKPFFRTAYFPSIVFFELVATSVEKSTFDLYSEWHRDFKKSERILTPTDNDWWETAKAIRRLYLNKVAPQTKLITLRTDALIARLSVKQKDSFIVTDDVDDFQIIKREMNDLKLISADEFFA